MALASLIVGTAELEAGGGVRAALPFLGNSLIEHQVRQAAAAGAGHIVILVERVPAALVTAIDRLKRDGIAVELARSVADAADRIHPEERLLVIADGLIARQELIARAGRADSPSLFVVPEAPETAGFERIDAGSRWAGIALIDGTLLRKTVAMLGEWDLQSTLLRRTVQAQALRIEVAPNAVTIADSAENVRRTEGALLAGDGQASWIPVPLRERLAGVVMTRGIKPLWLRAGALVLAFGGTALAAIGWPASAAVAFVLAGPLLALPARVDSVALRPATLAGYWLKARDALAVAAVLGLAWYLAETEGDWGIWPLAFGAIGAMIAVRGAESLLSRSLAGPSAMALLFFPFAAAGRPYAGLGAVAIAGFAALMIGQRLLGRRSSHANSAEV